MSNKKLAKALKNLVDAKLSNEALPVQNGDRINIGSYSIKPVKAGWSILSYKNREVIAETYTKAAALAIAKNLAKDKDIRSKVIPLDKIVQKHHLDCMFYAHIMKVTQSYEKYESTYYRYDISKRIEEEARDKIKTFIL